MSKHKSKPNLVILIDGLNPKDRFSVFEQEINEFIRIVNHSLPKKNSVIVYNKNYHTNYDQPNYIAEIPEVSFYDVITDVLKDNLNLIKTSRTVVNIIHNNEDFLDFDNKDFLNTKFLPLLGKTVQLNVFTNYAANLGKGLDFGVMPDVYSPMSAGIQTLISRMTTKTLNFLKGKTNARE